MYCQYCGASVQDYHKYCPKCGRPQNVHYCPNCGGVLDGAANFCDHCGQLLSHSTTPSLPSNKKPPRKKGSLVIGLTVTGIIIALVIVLLFIVPLQNFTNFPIDTTNPDDSASFSTEMLPGFVFDETEIIEAVGETVLAPNITGFSPSSGMVGTKIQISGNNLLDIGLTSVMIGETEMKLYTVSEDVIEAIVPSDAQSGDISLLYNGQSFTAGAFEVTLQEKQTLVENVLQPSADAQTVSSGTISVTFPGNVLTETQTVRIESIDTPQPINLPATVTGTAFSITAGDMHEFNDTVLIDILLPVDMPGEPSAAYFNETTSMWDTLPSDVVDGRLYIYTDHLTDFFVFYWGKAIYSPDGYFKIYYQENDNFSYANANNMDDLAQQVGVALEEARKDYEAKIPAAYRENFTYLGIMDSMDVYLDSGYGKGTYNAMTNNILLPTSFPSIDDFETMAAHELFHSYQDAVWNEIKGIGMMGKTSNMWAVEAITELAAYELAFPEKNRERHIGGGVSSQDPFYTFDEVHEYSMSCFLRYLLRETGSNFEDLWVFVASSDKTSLEVSLNDFFKSKSTDFISLDVSYFDFWRDVAGDSDAPAHDGTGSLFYKRMALFKANQHTAIFSYQTDQASTTAFNLFAATAFSKNIPLRVFNVECTGDSAVCTKLSGIKTPNLLNSQRIPDGFTWDPLYADSTLGDTNQLFSLSQGKDDIVLVLLEAVQANTPYSVKVSEIQGQCKPQAVDSVIPGQQQKFEVAFKDIFSYVKEIEVEMDFGDGTVKCYTKTNQTGVLCGSVTHTFGDVISDEVTISMYDVSGNGRNLISQLVIPIKKGEEVTLSASPNPAQPGETVSMSTNISGIGYMYRWEYGDGSTDTSSAPQSNHVYDSDGSFTAKVTVLNEDGNVYGTAQQQISISTTQPTAEATSEPSETPEPTPPPESEMTSAVSATPEPTTPLPESTEDPQATSGTPVNDMVIEDLDMIEWSGNAILTNVEFIEAYVETDEDISEGRSDMFSNEKKAKYNSILGAKEECVFMYGNSIVACILRSDHGDAADFAYVPCYVAGATLIDGVLTGENKYEGGEEVNIYATLTRDTDNLLMLDGIVNYTDVFRYNEDNPNQADKIVYSFTFSVKEVKG